MRALLKLLNIKSREQGFYLFLMISAYSSTLSFGIFYGLIGAYNLAVMCFLAFSVFLLFGLISFFEKRLVFLFRASITTAFIAFFFQTLFTGGIHSPSMAEFIIIPLLAYFYRPVTDRYYFFGLSGLAILAMWLLSRTGHTQQLIPQEHMTAHALMVTLFVFIIVAIFSILFRSALMTKNKLLGESMIELKDTTHKLVQSEKMASLGVLSAGVAHEINNPLNFIKGGIEGLAQELENANLKTAHSDQFVSYIKDGVNRAAVIVNSLSHFSRQSDDMNEKCDIHTIMENCLVMLQHKMKFKVEVEKDYHPKPIIMLGNEGKLHQAFINLFANAEQAIENKGHLKLTTSVTPEFGLLITIEDDGKGIKKEYLDRIRDPFFTTKPQGAGTGLGMTITYRIIEDHGGQIAVESKTGSQSGTMFTLHWPQFRH